MLYRFSWVFIPLICAFLSQIVYGVLRFSYYGRKLRYLLATKATPQDNYKGVDREESSYIFRLNDAVEIKVINESFGKILYSLHGLTNWLIFTVIVTGLFLCLTVDLLCFISQIIQNGFG